MVMLPLSLVPATRATVLRGWAPDLENDLLAPARASGADVRDIARLGLEHAGSRG